MTNITSNHGYSHKFILGDNLGEGLLATFGILYLKDLEICFVIWTHLWYYKGKSTMNTHMLQWQKKNCAHKMNLTVFGNGC